MEEVHQGICGPHIRMLAKKILRMGYYWNRMETDCVYFAKSCHDYQTHANLNRVLGLIKVTPYSLVYGS